MKEAYLDGGRPHNLDFTLERSWVEARWEPRENIMGGRLRVYATGVGLIQNQLSLNPQDPPVPGGEPAPGIS